MICSLSIGVLTLFGTLLVLVLTKDLIWLLKSLKYIKQGIPIRYFPFIGFAKYLDNPSKQHGLEDFFGLFQSPKSHDKTEKLIQMNGLSTEPNIFLNDQELIKEFFQKETEVSYTENTLDFPPINAFLFGADAHKVQKDRAIFAEIFYPKNLKKQTPTIRKIVQKHLDRIKTAVKVEGPESKNQVEDGPEIELKPYLKDIFTDIVSFVLFGGQIPKIEGELLVNLIDKSFNDYFNNRTSFLHIITGGLSTKLGLDSKFNEAERIYRKTVKKVKEVVKWRENDPNYQLGCNAIDLLILKNRDLEAQYKPGEKMTYDQIADNILSIVFAGMDTSRNLTESSLYKLSRDSGLQQGLREAVREQVLSTGEGKDYDMYDNSELLDAFIKEALRLFSPTSMSFHRRILKTFKLGQYTINKGDFVVVPYTAIQIKPEVFGGETRKFDLSKYEEKKRIKHLSKSVLIPFSAGKRACLGRNLAYIMVKVILCNFLDQFELGASGEPNRRFLETTIGLEHCKARLRSLR